MKKTNIKLFVITVILLSSCSNIDKKEITIVDDIVLGLRKKDMFTQIDSLGLIKNTYLTKSFFSNIDEIEDNMITTYETHVFDLSKYQLETSHIGLFYPITASTSNDNIIGVNILFGHTNSPTLISPDGLFNLEKESGKKSFFQDIPFDLLQEIRYELKSKYGEPIVKSKKAKENEFYVIEKSLIKEFIGGESEIETGAITEWKTKYLDIKLFEGLYSNRSTFTNKGYSYSFNTDGKIKVRLLGDNESPCVSYVYLQYKLNKETVEKLKLNEAKF